jgi:hypothetical protein
MSLDVLTAIWRAPPCKGGNLLVLLAIADNADDDGWGYPGVDLIARKSNMSKRNAQKNLRHLEEAGLIVVEEGGGRGKSNAYQIACNGFYGSEPPPPAVKKRVSKRHPLNAIKGGVSAQKGELDDAKPCRPVHPNRKEPSKEHIAEVLTALETRHPKPRDSVRCSALLETYLAEGVDEQWIKNSARRYAEDHKDTLPMYVQFMDNWLCDQKWTQYPPPNPTNLHPSIEQEKTRALVVLANAIKSGDKPYLWSGIKKETVNALLLANLVTLSDLEKRDI